MRQLLVRAQPYSHNDCLLGSRLGLILRRLDPSFNPGVLGDSNLGALLSRFPDVGNIVSRTPDLIFRYSSPLEPSVSASFSPAPGRSHIDRELWNALVANRAGPNRYLDLHTNKVVASLPTTTDPTIVVSTIDEEPERYLRIPPIPQDELRSVALEFVESYACDSEVRADLRAHLNSEDWFNDFTNAASAVGALIPWLNAHRAFVTTRVIAWLKKHNIDPNLFIKRQQERPIRRPQQLPLRSHMGLQRDNLREVLTRAISRMPDEDLLNISIPIRYLIS